MRLICPNCGAQYEVPDEVIPDTGRDVQCSNCGDTWFQSHPDHHWQGDIGSDDPGTQNWQAPADEEGPGVHGERPPEQSGEDPPRQPRQLDPSVADVLREEAEREQRQRSAETPGGLESQPELGLEAGNGDQDERARQARARMARLRGQPEEQPETAVPEVEIDPGSRRDMLPDIEEINSSLGKASGNLDAERAEDNRAEGAVSTDANARRGGFSRGFMVALLIALLLLLLYRYAPLIAARVPALENALAVYVDGVNSLRAVIDRLVSGQADSG